MEQEDPQAQPLTRQQDQHHQGLTMDSTAHLDLDQIVEFQEVPQVEQDHSAHQGPLEALETTNHAEVKSLVWE